MIPNNSLLISLLVLVGSLLNLSSRFATSALPFRQAHPMASVLSISLPEAIHHLMTSTWPLAAARTSGGTPSLSVSLTLTLESFNSSRAQEVWLSRQEIMKGVRPNSDLELTLMSGCARRRETMEAWPLPQAA